MEKGENSGGVSTNPERDQQTELSKAGYRFLKEGLLDEAEDCFRQILEIEAANNYALVGLGEAARKRGRFDEAVEHYELCLEHPDILRKKN